MNEPANALGTAISKLVASDDVKVLPYPAVAARLKKLIDADDYGVADLVKVIETDQALVTPVIRHANTARFGANQVTSLDAAVRRLGGGELTAIVFAASLGADTCTEGPLRDLRFRVWRDALLCSHLSQVLASARDIGSDEAFLCGMLHNLGSVVAISCIEQIIAAGKVAAEAMPASFWQHIIEQYRSELGLVMVAKWGLPDLFKAVVIDDLEHIEFRSMVEVTQASHSITKLLAGQGHVSHSDLNPILSEEEERTLIAKSLVELPDLVATLCDSSQRGEAKKNAAPKTHIVQAETALEGDQQKADFTVAIARAGGFDEYTAYWMTPMGLSVGGAIPLQENALVRIAFDFGPKTLEFWTNVVLCVREQQGYRIELRPFGLDAELNQQWEKMYRQLSVPPEQRELLAWEEYLRESLEAMNEFYKKLGSQSSVIEGDPILGKARKIVTQIGLQVDEIRNGDSSIEQLSSSVEQCYDQLKSHIQQLKVVSAGEQQSAELAVSTSPQKPAAANTNRSASAGGRSNTVYLIVASVGACVLAVGVFVVLKKTTGNPSQQSREKAVAVATSHGEDDHSTAAGAPKVVAVKLQRNKVGDLEAKAIGFDPDGEEVKLSYRWYHEGHELYDMNDSVLLKRLLRPGVYEVGVRASDGHQVSVELKSGKLTVEK